jgi:serine-type D-Ala-D-Ala carboxypeptidase (penicillin-binding protein 5/6)
MDGASKANRSRMRPRAPSAGSPHGLEAYHRAVVTSAWHRRWWVGVALFTLVFVAGGGVAAAMRLRGPVPAVSLRTVLPTTTRVPGTAPALSWPKQGQVALVAEGVGTLGVRGQAAPVPIGSVAKVMTALIVLRDHPLTGGATGPSLTVRPADERAYVAARGTGDSLLRVVAGERITERQAIEALMVPSADNIADLLARWDAGSSAAFVAKMNRTATGWGATHTRYADASGLSRATTSTATDQIRIGEQALRHPVLRAIMAQRTARLPLEGEVANYNTLLGSGGVIGIKTGSTRAAGGNLLFAAQARVQGRTVTLVGAVLGQAVGAPPLAALKVALAASRVLIRQATSSLRTERVLVSGEEAARGMTAWGQQVMAHVSSDRQMLTLPGQVLQIHAHPCHVSVPARAGDPCGSIELVQGDDLSARSSATVALRLGADVPEPRWTWRLMRRS